MRASPLLLALVPTLGAVMGVCQDTPTAHTSFATIRPLDAQRLEAGEPVLVEGIVIFSGFIGFTMHDGRSAMQVAMDRDIPRPTLGEQVRVEGVTGTNLPGAHTYPLVIARRLSYLGPGILPEPKATTVRELSAFRDWDQWVVVEGRVLDQSWSNGERHLLLAAPDGWAVIHVRNTPRETFSPGLIGARIRATGANQGYDHTPMNAMMVPDPSFWTVVEPASTDLFARPEAAFADLAKSGAAADDLVKTTGRVVHVADDGQIFLRDEDGQACRVTGFSALPKPGPEEGERSEVLPFPELRPGEKVEVVGFAVVSGTDLWLRFSRIRVMAPKPDETVQEPGPVHSSVEAVLAGEAINQLVTVSGRLVEQRKLPLAPGRYRTVLLLEHEGHLLEGRLDSGDPDPFTALPVDHLVEATGVLPGNERATGATLVFRSPKDAVSRGLDPSALFRRVWIWGGLALVLFGLLSVWVVSLRRSLNRAERAEASVRDLNSNLEDRVRERTSELVEAHAELDRALGQERELGQLKTRFVAMVSHEFRTPLGVTMSALELLRHHRDRLPSEKQGELLDDIFSATLRMSGMMEQILLLGRADSGKLNLRPVPLDLPGLIRQLADEALAAAERTHPITFEFTGDLSPVPLDESLLRLILGNLISNAIKYSPPDGTVRLVAARAGDRVSIEIIDEGIGIPAEDQAHLFEAFHRAGNVGETSGTGLGLLLVKRCVEIHHGTVAVESEAGRGSTFRLSLPVDPG